MKTSKETMHSYLAGDADPLAALDWLQTTLMPEIVLNLNTPNARRRIGIYAGEKIPENERNLTDVRNRVSLIIEYELARMITHLLESHDVPDLFCGYVVANRFPDLEMRQSNGKRGLRLEVKGLQTIAEEKSANFDTLRKDIHPQTDFVVVFLWEWQYDAAEVTWDRAVFINRVFVFHAASLALLRDWYWLNRPPADLGGGLQGFDLRYAVNCRNGQYNEEEGNYGKLLRIWQEGFAYEPPMSPLLSRTIADYVNFKSGAITAGFDSLAHLLLPGLSGQAAIEPVQLDGQTVGWSAGDLCFLLSSAITTKDRMANVLAMITASHVYTMTDKYDWRQYLFAEGKLVAIRSGRKPKRITLDPAGN